MQYTEFESKCKVKGCTRPSIPKEYYIKHKNEYGQAQCGGCHKPILMETNTSKQYHDLDGVLISS